MSTNSEAQTFVPENRPISQLNRPTRDLILAARRERGLVLRASIASLVHKVALAFAGHRKR
ncbi:MAG: hypothetical protein JSS04_04720, partial [Proteobacteria bacterium]|nr:hypothetical protein [Pseudomonadota bacterium]